MSRIGLENNVYQFWQKGGGPKEQERFQKCLWIRTTFIDSCIFEQYKDIQEVLL